MEGIYQLNKIVELLPLETWRVRESEIRMISAREARHYEVRLAQRFRTIKEKGREGRRNSKGEKEKGKKGQSEKDTKR